MADIRKRKKKLEDDLELLEDDFEYRISKAQQKILGPFQPVEFIKKNPLKAVATSVIAGVALGLMGTDKSSDNRTSSSNMHKEKLFDLVFNEVKRVAARKAASYLSDLIDEKITRGE